jgi:glucosamine-6-phosphate deaminase
MRNPQGTFEVGRLRVEVHPTRPEMGLAAARAVAHRMRVLAGSQADVRMVFAAAASQNEFLETFIAMDDVPWEHVTAFHMDEYLDLQESAPQLFGRFLRERLFDRVPLRRVHFIDPQPSEAQAECARYAALLSEAPIDITCMGIGENGHLAFNDPPVADFDDPAVVKMVTLDAICRRQQVNDGAFEHIEAVPKRALTLTLPTLMASRHCVVVVPGPTKARALAAALQGPIETACPASVLRRHPDATLFLDATAAAHLSQYSTES